MENEENKNYLKIEKTKEYFENLKKLIGNSEWKSNNKKYIY